MTDLSKEGRAALRERSKSMWGLSTDETIACLDEIERQEAEIERRDKDWLRWLHETRIAVSEQNFDIETAIVCGNKKPTLHDAGQCGYAAGLFAWEAAIKKRLAALSETEGAEG